MLNRLTLATALFAVLASTSIALAAGPRITAAVDAAHAAPAQVRIVELPRVVVVGKRVPA